MKTGRKILIAFLMNLGFSVFEMIGGLLTGSVAILSDAVHDMGDAASIGLSYILERKSKQAPDAEYTYGYARYSVIGAVITTCILLLGSAMVISHAVRRMIHPGEIHYNGMIVFAVVGMIINVGAAVLTHHGDSLNEKAVNLHMLEDALGWIVVLIGSVVMKLTGFVLIDPIMSIGISVFILVHAVKNLRESMEIFLEKAPHGVEIEAIRKKYLPPEEDKMEQLRRLHRSASEKAQGWSIALGVIGTLIMGTGMSLAMTEIGALLDGLAMIIGIVIGIVGIVLVALAYPVYNRVLKKQRERIAPEILRLTEEQSAGDDKMSAKMLGENENLLRIMTMHKSKGLEFPVVFCMQMSGKLHKGLYLLHLIGIRHTDDAAHLHQLMGIQNVLQLAGVNVVARRNDHPLGSALEIDKALLVHGAQIAGMEPSIF